MQQLMTIKDAANYLKISYSTIYKLVERGRIPAAKVGGAWRFKRDVLDDWLNSQIPKSTGTVLIVDDDARVRDVIRDIVIEQGYQVVTAENGERAVEEIERQHFDLVLLDLVLPNLSGIEVLRKLKAKDDEVMVVIVTGYGDYPIALEAMALGPILVVRKPFLKSDITYVLNTLTRVRR